MDPFSILVLFLLLILVLGYAGFLIKYPRRAFPFPKNHAPDWISVSIQLTSSLKNAQFLKEVLTPYANELNWSIFQGPDILVTPMPNKSGKIQKPVKTDNTFVMISPNHWGSITPKELFSTYKKIKRVAYTIYKDVIHISVPEGQEPGAQDSIFVDLVADIDNIIIEHGFCDIFHLNYFLVDRMRFHDTDPDLERDLFPNPLEDDLRYLIQGSLKEKINLARKNTAEDGQKDDSISHGIEIVNSRKHELENKYGWDLGKDLV